MQDKYNKQVSKNSKNILVISGESGIGESITKILLNRNSLTITTRKPNRLHDQTQVFNVLTLDVTKASHFEKVLSTNTYDWIIYCAGHISKNETLNNTELIQAFSVNMFGAFHLFSCLEKHTPVNTNVILISSTAGLWGNETYPLYASSKAALNGLGLSMAKKYSHVGKKCIVICPGPTNTKMREEIALDARQKQSPDQIAQVVKKIIDGKIKPKDNEILVVHNSKLTSKIF